MTVLIEPFDDARDVFPSGVYDGDGEWWGRYLIGDVFVELFDVYGTRWLA